MEKNDFRKGSHVIIEELHISDRNVQNMARTLARILVDKTLIEQGVKPANDDQ